MKKLLFLLMSCFVLVNVNAQHQLVKLWETDSVLKVPESVLYDAHNKVLYVSNIDGTQPWGKDGKGSVGKIGLDGKVIAAEWVTGLNAPKGMGLYKGKLYVADLNEIAVIDIEKAVIEKTIPLNATGLNDITVSPDGKLYVSDSRMKKVHMVPLNAPALNEPILDSTQLKGPNGVLFHNGTLYVLDAGNMYKLDKSGVLIKLSEGMEGGTDGVEHVSGNEFIVSTWSGVVYYVKADGSKEVLMDGRAQKINSADIGYDAKRRIVYVPTFWKNTVAAYELK
ncbi:MAG: ATP/GTP-binding protein [Chitinophagaceae bacterium]|nr:ATP/GTP-binding protein [Chitinophagaceae bacterium]